MSRKTELDSTAAVTARRQPLLTMNMTSSNNQADSRSGGASCRRSRMGETAGECAAVCCCCPCAMVHLFLLAVYRLPRGLWRKKKRKFLLRKKKKNSAVENANNRKSNAIGTYAGDGEGESTEDDDCSGKNDAVDWDNEMWDQFDGAGFWRSASQRNDDE